MSDAPVRVQRLEIEELFGPGTPTIDIGFKLEDRVTVLYGLNGSGKTVTLNILYALYTGRYAVLEQYPFKRICLTLSSGDCWEVFREGETLAYRVFSDEGEARGELVDWRAKVEGGWSPEAAPSNAELWELGGRSVHSMFAQVDEEDVVRVFEYRASPELFRVRSSMPTMKLIPIERRHMEVQSEDEPDRRRSLTVSRIAHDIRNLVSFSDWNYRDVSIRLGGSFASRILKAPHVEVSLPELKAMYRSVIEQESLLKQLGLVNQLSENVDLADLSDANKGTFHVILKDRREKLNVFRELADKAQHVLGVLNRKFNGKSITLNVETGYHVTSRGKPLPLERLSSGEQHELILQHEMLFGVAPGTLILMDEPELSTHVAWQEDFVEDFQRTAELNDLHLLVATHSPYIANRPELMVRLESQA